MNECHNLSKKCPKCHKTQHGLLDIFLNSHIKKNHKWHCNYPECNLSFIRERGLKKHSLLHTSNPIPYLSNKKKVSFNVKNNFNTKLPWRDILCLFLLWS